MSWAVAVPEGKVSFSRTIMGSRSGDAKKTPKYASAKHHPSSCRKSRSMGPLPSLSQVSFLSAGMTPTSPAESGITPTAAAVVCTSTFSCGVNGLDISTKRRPARLIRLGITRNSAKPNSELCSDMMLIQPDCRPR